MSSVCIFSGWACAACIVGLQAASKNKSKVCPEVGFMRLEIGWKKMFVLNPAERPGIN
jgi:hypothetical protein